MGFFNQPLCRLYVGNHWDFMNCDLCGTEIVKVTCCVYNYTRLALPKYVSFEFLALNFFLSYLLNFSGLENMAVVVHGITDSHRQV